MLVGDNDIVAMRDLIALSEHYAGISRTAEAVEEDPAVLSPDDIGEHPVMEALRDVVFKMRSFMESADDQEFALGVETGMQRAADLVERVLRDFGKGE